MPITLVGLGLSPDALSEQHEDAIDMAQVLVAGKRHLALHASHPAQKIELTADLDAAFAAIRDALKAHLEVVVLASGDPFFYGIGPRLAEAFSGEDLVCLPNVTTLQTAANRLKIPWQDIASVSLHGRDDLSPLLTACMQHRWVAVHTDPRHIPAGIAQALLDRGADWFVMWVLAALETDKEEIARLSLVQASGTRFPQPNFVLLERVGTSKKPLALGTADDDFACVDNVLTKQPVRATGVAALSPRPGDVIWDVGAGCGSVAIEAAAVMRQGRVYAIEKRGDRLAAIRTNARDFGALIVEPVHASAPACFGELPDPDAVFIGGGLSEDPGLLDAVCARLRPGGRLAVHCVLLNTLEELRRRLDALRMRPEIQLVQVSQAKVLGKDLHFEALNPVFVVHGVKRA
ncbi:bifunctional cobalt-precorrin-7 (C(5))-methyltransferase/cobalt-precorrin-6B (C(15))-methyltransferase [Megalodesulfovibrio gigas]|uniref:Putative precorrin-6y C5,15-methyltransferase subunit CbiE n=1 Tax=Megalodesulfovibrio gigas (strain ATCC 19364 / DSM 1382 / NCIMB 9332 / VKM B-1759) TaxID=1121448 RepID=T2G8K4_MEGG1|nr:bifunctional cobalt-precorrin-7 (C(5))-methyltransferase/cobalt-precorrin-6B (C(15))-methyltransferase [Megalodesulfovibrio gigas]AGW12471.1 putative precorrin-6y C5,15-methyltransferase subunit CbiE [Megalodesulfovibrio gigas DSM 1382 = ATCC 19364]